MSVQARTRLAAEVRAVEVLRAVGQRATRPRIALLGCVLAADGEHLSADTLLNQVGEREPTVHRATIYRTLEGLTKVGVLRHVHLDRGLTAYHLADGLRAPDPAAARTPVLGHLHAQCAGCGRVVDLPATVLGDTVERVREASGFVLEPEHVALSGRCADCARHPEAHEPRSGTAH